MLELLCTLYIFILFSFITKVHIYWMQGGIWPGENKQDLIDKVIGRGRELPNTFSFIIVIAVFLAMALLPLFFYFNKVLIPSYIVHYVFLFFALILFVRSMVMFIPVVAQRGTQIFLKLNLRIYAPLCFSLSLAFSYLSYLYL